MPETGPKIASLPSHNQTTIKLYILVRLNLETQIRRFSIKIEWIIFEMTTVMIAMDMLNRRFRGDWPFCPPSTMNALSYSVIVKGIHCMWHLFHPPSPPLPIIFTQIIFITCMSSIWHLLNVLLWKCFVGLCNLSVMLMGLLETPTRILEHPTWGRMFYMLKRSLTDIKTKTLKFNGNHEEYEGPSSTL